MSVKKSRHIICSPYPSYLGFPLLCVLVACNISSESGEGAGILGVKKNLLYIEVTLFLIGLRI